MSINNKRIYLSPPQMSGDEIKYINEAFEQNWVAPLGPNVDAFEDALAHYCGVDHAAALSSGTAAIHLSLIILDVKPGDEVIASTFTFSATINPIVYQGAIPVLIDSEPGTWNMSPELLETAIKDRIAKGKKPKAIIPVHLYGMPANIDEIIRIANQYEIPIIEDAAEALGSRYKSKPIGSFGKMAVLSFNGNKIITTSGGGALLSNDEELIIKAKFLATQARDKAAYYQHSQIGYNYRMSNVLAGIGRGQMEVIEERVKRRRFINQWYREVFKDVPGVTFHSEQSPDFFSNYWLTCINIDPSIADIGCEDLRLALESMNIEARPLWKPMHLQPVFAGSPAYINGISEELFNTGICLPSGSNMSEDDMNKVLNVILKKMKNKKID